MNSQFASLLSITLFSLLFMSTFYSTSLSSLLLLNGLFCFSKKTTEVSLGQNNKAWLSLLITTGFDNDFTMDYQHLCSYGFYDGTQSSFYSENCLRDGFLVTCKDEAAVSRNLKTYYSFTLDCNVSRDYSGVQLAITPNQVSTPAMHEPMLGSVLFNSKLTSEVCGLNETFYFYFTIIVFSFQALLTTFLFLVNNNRKLSEASTLNGKFRFLIGPFLRNKIISYCNPFNNSPILLSEGSCDCFAFVNEALDSVDKLWEKDMFYYNSGCSYFTKISENGKRIFLSDDNQGHFVLELNSGTVESSILCKYLMIKKNKLIINDSGHYPNLKEAYDLAQKGKVIRVVKSKVTCVTGGKDFNFGSKYFYRFFNRVDKTAVKNVMNGDYRNPNPKIYKNSEWKVFSSDLFFHFKMKPQSRIKKMKPSKTFLSFNESEVELPDQNEEEAFDEICNNLIIYKKSTGGPNRRGGGFLKNNNLNRKEGEKNESPNVNSFSLLKETIELEEQNHIIGEDYENLVNKGKDYSLRRIRYFDFINRKGVGASSSNEEPDFDYNRSRGLFRYGNNFINMNAFIDDHLEEMTLLNISYDSNIIRAKPGWVKPSNKNLAFFKIYKKHYDSYEDSFKKEKLGELNSHIEKIKWDIERYTGFMEKAKSQGQRKKYADLIKPLTADLEREEEKVNSLKLIGEAPVMVESDYQGILLTSIHSLEKIDGKGNPCLKEEVKEVKKININKEIKKWEETVNEIIRGDKKSNFRKSISEGKSKKGGGKGGRKRGGEEKKGKSQSAGLVRIIKNEDVLKEMTVDEKDFLSEVIKKTMKNCSIKGKRPGVKNVEIFLKTRTRERTFVLGDLKKGCHHYGLFKLAQKIFIKKNSGKKAKSNVCFECQNCLDKLMLMRVKELNNVRRNKFILNLISKFSKNERNSEIANRILEMMETKGFVLKNLIDIQNEMMEIMKKRVIVELSILKEQ